MVSCFKCDLSITRTHVVLGSGNKTADIMLIGEAPGHNEDKTGVPFVGDSGKYIRELFASHSYSEENMFITNTVKCRPPRNKTPDNQEISICTKLFLFNEIKVVDPVFIITAGAVSTSLILGQQVIMKKVVDTYHKIGKRWVFPIYHPSYILQTPNLKDYYVESISNVIRRIEYINTHFTFDIAATFSSKSSPF